MAIPKFDVTIYGMALNNFGFTEQDTIDGLGLNTFGLIWGCQNIWFGPYYSSGLTISTSWAAAANATVSTVWTANATVTTVWTDFSTYYDEDC